MKLKGPNRDNMIWGPKSNYAYYGDQRLEKNIFFHLAPVPLSNVRYDCSFLIICSFAPSFYNRWTVPSLWYNLEWHKQYDRDWPTEFQHKTLCIHGSFG